MKKLTFFALFLVFLGAAAWGETFVWNGVSYPTNRMNWENPDSWTITDTPVNVSYPGQDPDRGDIAIINSGSQQIYINTDITLGAFTINMGCELILVNNHIITVTDMTVTERVTFSGDTCTFDITNLTLGLYAQYIYSGTITLTNLTVNNQPSYSGTLIVTGMTTLNGTLQLTGTMSIVDLTVGSATAVGVQDGTVTMDGAELTVTPYNANLSINGNASFSTGIIYAPSRAVSIVATSGNITIDGAINAQNISIETPKSTGTVTLTGNGSMTATDTVISPTVCPESSANVVIYIRANIFTATGSGAISPGTSSYLCLNVNSYNPSPLTNVAGDRYHTHLSTNNPNAHLVYCPSLVLPGGIPTPYNHIVPSSTDTSFSVNAGYNIYIVDVGTQNASLTFTTSGAGFIEIRGTYASSSTLALNAGTGGIRLSDNAAVNLSGTGNNFNIGTQPLTLAGTGNIKTITAATVTLGAVTGGNRSLTITGNAVFGGAVTGVTALSVSGTSAINANITTTGAQTYTGAVTFNANRTFTANAGSLITFGSTVGSSDANPRALTITTADVRFNGQVGAANGNGRVLTLTVNAGTAYIDTANVYTSQTTTGNHQYYYGPVVLDTNVTFTGGSAANSTIRFNDTVNGTGLTVTNAITRIVVSVTTTGNQTYTGAVQLGRGTTYNSVILTADAGSKILFSGTGSTIRSNNTTARALAIRNADVQFDGQVGITGATGTGIISSVTVGTATVSGTAYINANIYTTGTGTPQRYYGPVVLGADVTFTGGNNDRTIHFDSTVNGDNNTRTLTIATASASFNGNVGGVGLASVSVAGATAINTASITTTGVQTYTGTVTLGTDVNLSADSGNSITFGNIVNGAFGLTITTADVQFSNTVGGTTPLASVNVSVGSSRINASITTTGTQTYTGAVALGGNINFTSNAGSLITFGSTVRSNNATARALTITNANVQFDGAVGSGNPISTLDVNSGTAAINADVTTTGNQLYRGIVTLTGTRVIESTGGNITTGTGLVSASDDVTIKASNGITIGGGGINAATDLTLESGGNVTQSGAIITGTLTLAGGAGFTLNNTGNNIDTLQTMAVLSNIYPAIINYTDADGFDIGTGELQAVTRVELKTTGKITIEKNINVTGSGVVPGDHEENAAVYIEANELEGEGAITFTIGSGHWVCAYITQSTGFTGDVNENGIHYHTTDGRHIVYSSGDSSSFASSLSTTHLLYTESYLYIQADNDNLGLRQDVFTSGSGNIYIVNVDDGNPLNPALTRIVSFNTVSGVSGGHIEIWGKYTAESPGKLTLDPGSGGVVLIDAEINLAGNFNTNGTPLTVDGTSGSEINAAGITLGKGIEGVSGLPSDLTLTAGTIHITGTAGSGTPASLGDLTITGELTLENTILSASSFSFNNGQVTLVGDVDLETNNGDIKLEYNAIAPSITGSGNLTMTAGSGDVSILGQAGQSSSHIGDIRIVSAGDVTFSSGVYAGDISVNSASYVTFSNDIYAEDISVSNADDVTFSGDVNAGDVSVNNADEITFSSDVYAGDISVNNAGDVTFSSGVYAGNISVNNADEVTLSSVVSSGNVTINNGGLYTQNGNVTVNGNFNQTGTGDVDLDGGITINNAAVIGFVSEITLGSSAAFNAPVGGTVKLKSVVDGSGSYTLTLNGGSASSPLLVEQANTGGMEIDGSLIITAGSYVKINSGSTLTQNGNKGLTLGTNAVLDTSAGAWHIGTAGTPDSFTGDNGELILGENSKLITHHLNLTGSAFKITNTDWVTISVKGSVEITDDVTFSGSYPQLIIEMDGTGTQTLTTERPLGSLHVGTNSHTIIETGGQLAADKPSTVIITGMVKIFAVNAPYGLDAGDYNIVMYAGLTGNRNLTNYTHNGSDSIRYTRWENVSAPIVQPPYSSVPDVNSFVFRQNPGGRVSFQRDPADSSSTPVFFEIAGNTMWREFECSVPGAVVQFSRHPHHHVVLEDFSIGNKSSTAADHSDYVTITRLTDNDYINFPYIYDSSVIGPPPLTSAGANVGDLGNYALPVYYPPLDLKNAVQQEKEKYWNINFVTVSGPAQKPLDNFRYVRIFFSHAYNQRIPIETSSMHLDAVPYYRPLTGEGHFNFDWIELRKILYSFTEDSSGDGRLDRIRVQTNVRLNGDFSAFEVNVEGYQIDTSIGTNGFLMVNALTGYNDDEDSFYIYLRQVPYIDGGNTPLWSVTRNGSLKDLLTESSSVGDPEVDVDMKPFDTIPPRISHTLTIPGHPQTYVRMTEPVLSLPGGNISDAQAVERSQPYIFTWKYFPYDGEPVHYTMPVISANLGYLLNMPSSFDIETLSRLKNIFGDTTSSETDGYFRMDNVIDQGQSAMDWHDSSVDPAFYIYYQPPKYPLNWGYTEYAKVYGNSHLAGRGLLSPDFSIDETDAIKSDGSPVPLSQVFLPPNKMLSVEMMTLIARGDGNQVTPQNFSSYSNPSANDSVIRRITDVLISLAPAGGDSENYFAWPVWARYQDNANPDNASLPVDFWSQRNTDTGVIWTFDGTAFLEARGFDLQARMNSVLTGNLELFWTTDIPTEYRIPQVDPVRGRNTGGLWLPYPGDLHNNRLLYYFAPLYEGSAVNQSGASSPVNPPLFNFAFNGENSSGKKMEFVFRINGSSTSDLFVARLDIPRTGAIPENWYYLVRPFGFDIQDIRLQRGGVTVLNNVINSDARENAFIRYHLVRPGRVTVQVYTLDGTLVKSLRRNEYREAGEWTDSWDGTNNSGRSVARGMYFVRVVAPDIDEIRKIMVVR